MILMVLSQVGEWQPLQFHEKEHFEYSIVQTEEGEKSTGNYSISIEGNTLKIEGKWKNSGGTITIQTGSPDEIPGQLMGQMLFNPWLAPLGYTLFATIPYYAIASGGITSMEQTQDGKRIKLTSGNTCSYAGQKGKRLTIEENGKVVYDLCISGDIGLPLYMKSVSDDGSIYEATLKKYSR